MTKKTTKTADPEVRPLRQREIGALIFFFLAVFTALSLFGVRAFFLNILSDLYKGLVGRGFYVAPFTLLFSAYVLLFHRNRPVIYRLVCVCLIPLAVGAITHLFWHGESYVWTLGLLSVLFNEGLRMESGGLLGGLLGQGLSAAISVVGATIVLLSGLVYLLLSALRMTVAQVVDLARGSGGKRGRTPDAEKKSPPDRPSAPQQTKHKEVKPARPRSSRLSPAEERRRRVDIPVDMGETPRLPAGDQPASIEESVQTDELAPTTDLSPVKASSFPVEDKAPVTMPAPAPVRAAEIIENTRISEDIPPWDITPDKVSAPTLPYRLPPLSLLSAGQPAVGTADGMGELKSNAALLLETIRSFGIEARIVSVTRGPTVARYELELDRGVKLSRLTGLADDIALSLGTSGVRIAPVPGKMSVVGIEVPNKLTSIVYLSDIVDSPEFRGMNSKTAFAVGKDIGGNAIVCDISQLTHLLIAGTTGSGKSVCMNSLIVSLLYKASPDEVRLIMIDPKMVELGVYNGIPHLIAPVVTDSKRAAGALHKVVIEMEDRYRKFMQRHVRDIFTYNAAIAEEPDTPPLPRIVVIIDELADLMLVAAKEVEESICRIAQKARAAGIHLVIATQRPSADVITGLMKANIPSRIAFAVASQLESRIILDTMGAEKLVGRGDMLLYPLGAPKPFRVQGCLISGAEVEEVVQFVKASGAARYSEEFIESVEMFAEQVGKKGGFSSLSIDSEVATDTYDDLFVTAVEVVLESGQASVSYLQRRLKLGFSRAARLVDQMEERGIVGPSEGSKPRQLRINRQQWQEMKTNSEFGEQK